MEWRNAGAYVEREIVADVVIPEVGIDVGVYDVKHIESACEDDTQVAIASVTVFVFFYLVL